MSDRQSTQRQPHIALPTVHPPTKQMSRSLDVNEYERYGYRRSHGCKLCPPLPAEPAFLDSMRQSASQPRFEAGRAYSDKRRPCPVLRGAAFEIAGDEVRAAGFAMRPGWGGPRPAGKRTNREREIRWSSRGPSRRNTRAC
jgi:hypothetical protein